MHLSRLSFLKTGLLASVAGFLGLRARAADPLFTHSLELGKTSFSWVPRGMNVHLTYSKLEFTFEPGTLITRQSLDLCVEAAHRWFSAPPTGIVLTRALAQNIWKFSRVESIHNLPGFPPQTPIIVVLAPSQERVLTFYRFKHDTPVVVDQMFPIRILKPLGEIL